MHLRNFYSSSLDGKNLLLNKPGYRKGYLFLVDTFILHMQQQTPRESYTLPRF